VAERKLRELILVYSIWYFAKNICWWYCIYIYGKLYI